jgi:hypothetical protein
MYHRSKPANERQIAICLLETVPYVSFRSPSHLHLLVHSTCRGFFVISLDETQTHTTVGRTPPDEGLARRRDLYVTKLTLTRDKHPCPPGGIRTHDPSTRSAAVLRLSPRGHWDRRVPYVRSFKITRVCPTNVLYAHVVPHLHFYPLFSLLLHILSRETVFGLHRGLV